MKIVGHHGAAGMESIRIVGHRGIRGVGTENTLAAFKLASKSRADAIEFDIQVTKDRQLVVCHAMNSPKKIYGIDQKIRDLSLTEIQKYHSKDGSTMPTFEEIMKLEMGKIIMLDVKDPDSAVEIDAALKRMHYTKSFFVNSLYPQVLTDLKELRPELQFSLHTYSNPFKAIGQAKAMDATGITLVLYLLNPLTYYSARRAGLKILVYQNYASFLLTWRWFVRLLWVLYPKIAIISDRPDKIVSIINR